MTNNEELIQALYLALQATPDVAPLHKHLADLLMANGDYDKAAKEYRAALDLVPEDDEAKLALAEAYYRQEKADVTLVILEELMRSATPVAGVFLLAASAYLDTGDRETANRVYQRAITMNPSLTDDDLAQRLVAPKPEETAAEALSSDDKVLFSEDDGSSSDDGSSEDDPLSSNGSSSSDDRILVTADEPPAPPPATDLERPQLTFADVGGMDKLKEEIRMKIIYPLSHQEIYAAYGKSLGGGILMYGPPGCGKTYLARATAGEVNAHFLAVGLHDVLDMYLGQSEHNLHNIFELARSNAPCVLFFDEVDALGANRSDMRYSAGRQVINQFLSELDGVMTSNEGVLILAATNAPWHLDPALRRPGRFDRVLFVPPPDQPARAKILELMLDGKPAEKIDYKRLGRQTDGFSGADLKGVVDVAIENKLREAMRIGGLAPVMSRDLQDVIKTVHPTTKEWFATARNYAIYSNQGGLYDDILSYLNIGGSIGLKGLLGREA